jgi:photosystem II stability/assembly factor-like uncharacterized protein
MDRVGLRGLALVVLSAALVAPACAATSSMRDNLYGVKALSSTEAWAVGNFGAIYHTADAGKTWDARDGGTRVPLFGIDFAPRAGDGPGEGPGEGWIVGKASLILHTADGGRTWKPQKSAIPVDKHLFTVKAIDAKTVWVAGDWGAIAVTHDGGATWQDRSLGTLTVKVEETPERVTKTLSDDIILYEISFPDPRHGYIVGEFGTLLATADGGETWEKREVGTEKTLFGVFFSTPETGWVTGIDGLILHTRDGGRHWTVQHGTIEPGSIDELGFLETIKNPGLYDVAVAGDYGVVVGDTGNVLTTADGGETWTSRELPEKQRLVWMRAVSMVPGTHGFVVGAAGFAAAIDHDQVILPDKGTQPGTRP